MLSPTDLYLLQVYGPWMVIAVWLVREVWVNLRDKWIPIWIKRTEIQDEREISLEERQVRAFEKIAENTQKLTVLYATIGDRTGLIYEAVNDVKTTLTAHDARSQLRDATKAAKTKPLASNTRNRLQQAGNSDK